MAARLLGLISCTAHGCAATAQVPVEVRIESLDSRELEIVAAHMPPGWMYSTRHHGELCPQHSEVKV